MTGTPQDHADGILRFIVARRRQRLRSALNNQRLGARFPLSHRGTDLVDPRYATALDDPHISLLTVLADEGAPSDCVVLREHDLVPKRTALVDALDAFDAREWAGFISCVPGRLAVYFDEPPYETNWLLRRTD